MFNFLELVQNGIILNTINFVRGYYEQNKKIVTRVNKACYKKNLTQFASCYVNELQKFN